MSVTWNTVKLRLSFLIVCGSVGLSIDQKHKDPIRCSREQLQHAHLMGCVDRGQSSDIGQAREGVSRFDYSLFVIQTQGASMRAQCHGEIPCPCLERKLCVFLFFNDGDFNVLDVDSGIEIRDIC